MLSTCKDAKEAGFTCYDARAAGMLSTCKDAKDAGFMPRDCVRAGFTYEEGRAAGFPSRYRASNGTLSDSFLLWHRFDVDFDFWYTRKPPSNNSNPG